MHFEQQLAEPTLIPTTPLHKAVAWLLGFFGSESFLPTGLHYRWSYLEEQRSYLEAAFGEILSSHRDPERQRADLAPTFNAVTNASPSWGATPETIPTIEACLEACLDVLDRHFAHHPYLLGGRPSLADFGLMAPMFAHLARDPYPSAIMKARAPRVFRWTERMNIAGFVDGGFPDVAPDYFPDDDIPDTLVAFLRLLFADYGPSLAGLLASYNAWVDAHPDLPAGTIIQNNADVGGTFRFEAHPSLGQYEYEVRGVRFQSVEFIDAVYHFQRALDVIENLEPDARHRFDALVEQTGGSEVMALRPTRRLTREYYRLVLV